MTDDARARFRERIGDVVGVDPGRVTLFAKGRVALYAILRALEVGPGDEVIVPAFTCVAVPNAIAYTGATPMWVDVDPERYTIDPGAVEAAIGPRTRVILAQNTFGLSADLGPIVAIGDRHGVTVIDDCAHGLGGTYRGRANGSTTPFAFLSTQWSKPVSTGLGGVAIDRDGTASGGLLELERRAAEPPFRRVAPLRLLVAAHARAGHGRLFRAGRETYRALGRLDLVPGSSSNEELTGPRMPDGFLARLSPAQARLGVEALARLPAALERRREIAHRYTSWLVAHGRTPAPEPPDSRHVFLRYPLRARRRDALESLARRRGVDLGDWFVSPIHPITRGLDRWGYVAGSAPRAEEACREIVNLPTDPWLSDHDVERVLALIDEAADAIA
ncbi:MAG TPA: aminotransferase class I/II-fold pyridoxal phosphate-dependent enzyme [Candidatus Limnocylindrales bacterium]|nr:aminotransferase class I/II-fold pyridoxal phosphate-dependent enzyme [Candidatus Limnocylindrales bacterium]